ncbi:MAG: hypothetical protein ACLQL2_09085 [Methylovirgula sp.]
MKKLLIAAAVVAFTSTSAFAGQHNYNSLPTPQGFANDNHAKITTVGAFNNVSVIQTGVFTRNSADVSTFGLGNTVILIQD